jgi:2-polyprenyl-3-methyl-5-hydroxy-6-metoxy-1,4-benzoquinol methylase
MFKSEVTRGYGLLEEFLAKKRCKIANRLIPSVYRNGRILDIGCGAYPFFLLNTDFSRKYGLDKVIQGNLQRHFENHEIIIINHDIEQEDIFPFENEHFDIVTMLAVFEHVEPKKLLNILNEIYRILKPGGMYIMTTPAVWTDNLLRLMAILRLVSPVEIKEHKDAYSPSRIHSMLREANFQREKLRFGYFEMLMNIWVTATK